MVAVSLKKKTKKKERKTEGDKKEDLVKEVVEIKEEVQEEKKEVEEKVEEAKEEFKKEEPKLEEATAAPDEEELKKKMAEDIKKVEEAEKILEKEAKKEEDYNKSIEKRFQKLEKRLGEIEEAQRQNKLRCFLSFKFENPQTKTKALKVTQLLDLSDVEVITGEPYEPRKVSEKVKATLNQHLDFICLIVTSDGETMWTRDEINLAHSKGVPLVPLVEEGATFTPGMFGDHEEIRFPSAQIEEAFIKLLEAVNFIRSNPKQIEK